VEVTIMAGRPLKYKTKKALEEAIEAYFQKCKKEERPPTVTGLAYELGFLSRQALLNYQDRPEFHDTITRAKLRIETYAEERLFDREGVNGAKFSLTNNFEGWSNAPAQTGKQEALVKAAELLGVIGSAIE
jgi:hypothetical protein